MSHGARFDARSRQAARKLLVLLTTSEDFEGDLDEYVQAGGQIDEAFLPTLDGLRQMIQSDSKELAGALGRVSIPFQEALLEYAASNNRADLLEEWLSSADRQMAKVIKRAAHSLKTQGIEIEDRRGRRHATVEPQRTDDPISMASAIDSQGEHIVWLGRDVPGMGVRALQAVLSPSRGVADFEMYEISRSEYRKMAREITRERSFLVIEVPLEYALYLLRRYSGAFEPPDRFITAFSMISKGLEAPQQDPILSKLGLVGHEVEKDALEHGEELHRSPPFAHFVPDRTTAMRLELKLREIAGSRLVLDEKQRREQFESAVNSAIDDFFGKEKAAPAAGRIRDMAALLHLMAEERARDLALATAQIIERGDVAPSAIPFARQTFLKIFARWPLSRDEEQEEPKTSAGGIIMPGR